MKFFAKPGNETTKQTAGYEMPQKPQKTLHKIQQISCIYSNDFRNFEKYTGHSGSAENTGMTGDGQKLEILSRKIAGMTYSEP